MRYLGLKDLADRWGLSYTNIRQRRHRGELPPPDIDKPMRPLWAEDTIRAYETLGGHNGRAQRGD